MIKTRWPNTPIIQLSSVRDIVSTLFSEKKTTSRHLPLKLFGPSSDPDAASCTALVNKFFDIFLILLVQIPWRVDKSRSQSLHPCPRE